MPEVDAGWQCDAEHPFLEISHRQIQPPAQSADTNLHWPAAVTFALQAEAAMRSAGLVSRLSESTVGVKQWPRSHLVLTRSTAPLAGLQLQRSTMRQEPRRPDQDRRLCRTWSCSSFRLSD